jgi:hypothetical protein
MKKLMCFSFILVFAGLGFGQPKNIWVDWECNMEIEILSGRFNPAADTVSVRGDFNSWGRYDLIVDPLNPNYYLTPYPILIPQLEVGDTVAIYKFFYTPNTWEIGADRIYILTQEDYNNSAATISRAFNDATLTTVTNQPTEVLFTVDCNNAISAINGLPFPVINTCHIAGGTPPLQWPDLGWPDYQINLMIPMYDDGTNGDPTAGDKEFNALVTFPAYTPFHVEYKYGINYGDNINNGGGNDNEAGMAENHVIELEQLLQSAQVVNIFGQMGLHQLINKVYVPVELTSFSATIQVGVVSLNWTTATELNNLGFELERKIIAQENEGEWLTIGFVEGNGTTTETKVYSYNDRVSDFEATAFKYRLKQIDFDGSFEYSNELEVINSTMPDEYLLSQNYPNPFNPSTSIEFKIPHKEFVSIIIYDILGNKVATLVNEERAPGSYEVLYDASELVSGVYVYSLKAGTFVQTRKMLLLK